MSYLLLFTTIFYLYSTPNVAYIFSENLLSTYLFNKEDFPTPPSPNIRILHLSVINILNIITMLMFVIILLFYTNYYRSYSLHFNSIRM